MAVTEAKLATYVGAAAGEYTDTLTDCLAEAQALVDRFNVKRNPAYDGTTTYPEFVPTDAPPVIVDRAVLEVAADLFNRRNAPNGIVNGQFANFGGDQAAAVRIARDPMQAAYKVLQRWVLPW